jgi:hypothetical protein
LACQGERRGRRLRAAMKGAKPCTVRTPVDEGGLNLVSFKLLSVSLRGRNG